MPLSQLCAYGRPGCGTLFAQSTSFDKFMPLERLCFANHHQNYQFQNYHAALASKCHRIWHEIDIGVFKTYPSNCKNHRMTNWSIRTLPLKLGIPLTFRNSLKCVNHFIISNLVSRLLPKKRV